jgi:DNA polymerase/3'-5' exonuclease PolX
MSSVGKGIQYRSESYRLRDIFFVIQMDSIMLSNCSLVLITMLRCTARLNAKATSKDICRILENVRRVYAADNNRFKERAYGAAIRALESYDGPLESAKDVKGLPGVGKSMQSKIDEILKTGKLQQETELLKNDGTRSLLFLSDIPGFGYVGARRIVDAFGPVFTIDALKKLEPQFPSKGLRPFTAAQQFGVRSYNDLRERIPREEVAQHEAYICTATKRIDPDAQFAVCGSYRREMATAGDVDVLVSSSTRPSLLGDLCDSLTGAGYVKHVFGQGPTKFMGACALAEGPIRHVDIRSVAPKSFPAAMLYFTGSKSFNIRMREHAVKQGFMLNEYALSKANAGVHEALPVRSEKDIFDAIGMAYVEPKDRSS